MAAEYKYKVDNKMRGAFGETNFQKKVIRINKKAHKHVSPSLRSGFAKKELTLINTLVHERMHSQHPRMHEKTVRRKTRDLVKRMSTAQKQKLYKKLS